MKKPDIRKCDIEICDRSIMERWLYTANTSNASRPLTLQDLEDSEDVDVPIETDVLTTAVNAASLLENVVVLEVVPLSKAGKRPPKEPRDLKTWNQLWGLVRKIESLPIHGPPERFMPLSRVAGILHEKESTLRRYLFGYDGKKRGKPISPDSAEEFEKKLKLQFASASAPVIDKPSEYEQLLAFVTSGSACKPNDFPAIPLHASRTTHGLSAIYDLGDSDMKLPASWQWKGRGRDDIFQLRPGLTGRHVFGPKSKLHGRCFEWSVFPNKKQCGQPQFKVREFKIGKYGLRTTERVVTADNPNSMWNNLFNEIARSENITLSAPKRGAHLCGFDDVALHILMAASSERNLFDIDSNSFSDISERYQRHIADVASQAFRGAMSSVSTE